jgi:photosystem II CP43 chlorophyll apoprotein
MYEQGLIYYLPTTLGYGVDLVVVVDTFPFIISCNSPSSSVWFWWCLSLTGPETLEESFPFFGYVWKIKQNVLGIH